MGVDITRLTDKCRVILTDWGTVLSNIGLVLGEVQAAIIDPGFLPWDADVVMSPINMWIDRPISYVVYTHFYPNHLLGNQSFEGVQTISHQRCFDILEQDLKTTPPGKEIERWLEANPEIGARWSEVKIRLPDVGFEDELILDLTGTTLDLMWLGGGDTGGSIVAWIPEERIAYVGDLLFHGRHPYMVDADILAWIEALERVKLLDPVVVVPGHGDACSIRELDRAIHYLTEMREQIDSLLSGGVEADEIVDTVDLSEFGYPPPKSEKVFRLGILKALATILQRRKA